MNKQLVRNMLLIWGLAFAMALPIGKAQPAKLDSLIVSLEDMPEDTHKMYRLLDIGLIYLNQSENKKANQYYSEALTLSERLHHTQGKANAYGNLGLTELNIGHYENALRLLNISLEMNLDQNNRKSIANNYSNIGMVYDEQGHFDKAIESYTTALKYRDETDLRGISAAYNNLGIIYFKKGEYAVALQYYLRSLEIDEELGDKLDLAFSNNNVGMVYAYQKDFAKAISFYKKANSLCTEVGHKECMAGTNTNIAKLLKQQGHLPEALEYYFGSLKIFEEIGHAGQIGATAGNIGTLYHDLGEYELAHQYYTTALNQAKSVGDQHSTAIALSNLGSLNRDMHRYPEANAQLSESIVLLKQSGMRDLLQDTYLRLSMLDSMMGNFNDALTHYKLHIAIKDSIQNEASVKALSEVREKYESEKKDKEIVKLENEKNLSEWQVKIKSEHLARVQSEQQQMYIQNQMQLQQISLLDKDKKLQDLELEKKEASMTAQEIETRQQEAQLIVLKQQNEIKNLRIIKQRQVLWYSITGFVLVGLIATLYYLQYQARQKLKLQMLRNKIASDLHDEVGSTLSSISIFSEVAQQQSKEVIPLLNTIRDNSRKMLEAMGDIVWTINPENDQFEKIIVRMRNFAFELLGARKIEFEFIADEDVSQLKLPMEVRKNLYLIFKEASNNLVKYSEANKAYFSVTEEKGWLTMVISDNGRGFNLAEAVSGNGLESMKHRAKDIGAMLHIQSQPGKGTSIELKLAI
jgi:two-component system sensor histidine kinase UhpB